MSFDKKFYNMAPNHTKLQTPEVDELVVALASSSATVTKAEDVLRLKERKLELALHKVHQTAAWAIKTATAASFFLTRVSLLWLKQMQDRVLVSDLRTQQDFNKVVATAEFTADATLKSTMFGAGAIAGLVTARCMPWLKHCQTDTNRKWRLASAPFRRTKLFGASLDPVLVESRVKRRVFPSLARWFNHCPSPPFWRSYFCPYTGPAFQRSQRDFASRQYYQTGQGFVDKNHSRSQNR